MAILLLLGRAELARDESSESGRLRFLPERRFRLLAYLALRGDWVSRDELATLFWPNRPQEAARSNLRKLLQEARALDLPNLESERTSVRWKIGTDVARFKAALLRGDAAAAVALYRGMPLRDLDGGESDGFGAWLAEERRHLHASWREAVVALLLQSEPVRALELAQRLLDEDPFDEDGVVAQLAAHRALGDDTGAERTFRGYAERLMEELGVEPSARVRIAAKGQAEAALSSGTSDAEVTASDFIGRHVELEKLLGLISDAACRVVTITGAGGMGKSRLAKEVVRRLEGRHPDGVLWIALDDLTDVDQVAPRIASELSLSIAAGQDPVARVAAALAPRHGLLVLDNTEHLARLPPLVARLIDAAPGLQILTTSRSSIGLAREHVFPLGGLALPAPGEVDCAAVQLFVAHARTAHPRFAVEANRAHVVRIVRAVGGMPLAILLAASWVRLLPVSELARDVAESLDVLEGMDEGEERAEHRSVRATFEQSWRLLAPAERRSLAALSVMAGSFTRSAAKDISHAPLPLLASLVDKSLLQVDALGRFSLHPLIQRFAAEKLALEPPMVEAVRDRHAETYARFMAQYQRFEGIDEGAAVRAIGAELSNVLAAWNWAIARPRIDVLQRCMPALCAYFQWRGPIATALVLFAPARTVIDAHASSLTGEARRATWSVALEQAALFYVFGDYLEAEASARAAVAAARAMSDSYGVRSSLVTLSAALMRLGQVPEGGQVLEEALALAKADKAAAEIVAYSGQLCEVRREQGDAEGALRLARDALEGYRTAGQKAGELTTQNTLGLVLQTMGRFDEAIAAFDEGLRLAAATGMDLRRSTLLMHKASACLDAGQIERAYQGAREALQLTLQTSLFAQESSCHRTLAEIHMRRGDFDSARTELAAAISAARRDGSRKSTSFALRSVSAYLELRSDPGTALRLEACVDARGSPVTLPRYRGRRERLLGSLDPSAAQRAQAEGAALSLLAGLDLAERSLQT